MVGIAAKCAMTERGVRGIVRKLEADGWLDTKVGGGRGGKSHYIVKIAPETRNEAPGKADETRNDTTLNPEPRSPEPSRNHQNGGGDDAGARVSRDTDRERLLAAIGLDSSGLTGRGGSMLGTRADMQIAEKWTLDLGLTVDEQVEIIADVMAGKQGGPPATFAYFSNAMQRAAGAKAAPPLTPIATTPEPERTANAGRPSAHASDESSRVARRMAAWLAAAEQRAP
jgi:hypothetical protein